MTIVQSNPLNIESDNEGEEFIFENDMIVYDTAGNDENSLPDVIENVIRLWKRNGTEVIIPYTFPEDLTSHQQEQIQKAFREFHTKTCIVFKERENETDYVHIDPVNYPLSCRSTVGRKGGKQILRSGNCKVNDEFHYGPLLHELMHVVGFVHEHTRNDRDEYIKVDFEAIKMFEKDEGWPNGTWASQFKLCNTTRIGRRWGCKVLNPYDLNSITHYPDVIGENNPRRIIFNKTSCGENGCNIGQRLHLSSLDVADIEKLYGCSLN